jgi:hypothetical protein
MVGPDYRSHVTTIAATAQGSLLRCEICNQWMSARGHERRFRDVCGTSALPPILAVTADILNRQLRAQSASIKILARKKAQAPSQRIHTSNPVHSSIGDLTVRRQSF